MKLWSITNEIVVDYNRLQTAVPPHQWTLNSLTKTECVWSVFERCFRAMPGLSTEARISKGHHRCQESDKGPEEPVPIEWCETVLINSSVRLRRVHTSLDEYPEFFEETVRTPTVGSELCVYRMATHAQRPTHLRTSQITRAGKDCNPAYFNSTKRRHHLDAWCSSLIGVRYVESLRSQALRNKSRVL